LFVVVVGFVFWWSLGCQQKTRVEIRTDWRPKPGLADWKSELLPRFEPTFFCRRANFIIEVSASRDGERYQTIEADFCTLSGFFAMDLTLVLIPTVLKTLFHPNSAARETLKGAREPLRHQHRDIGKEL
jgi:hypothetical protein